MHQELLVLQDQHPPGSELIQLRPGTPSAGEYLSGLSDTGSFGDKGLEFLAKGAR